MVAVSGTGDLQKRRYANLRLQTPLWPIVDAVPRFALQYVSRWGIPHSREGLFQCQGDPDEQARLLGFACGWCRIKCGNRGSGCGQNVVRQVQEMRRRTNQAAGFYAG